MTTTLLPAPVVDVTHIIQLAQALLAAHDAKHVSRQHLALAALLNAVRKMERGT